MQTLLWLVPRVWRPIDDNHEHLVDVEVGVDVGGGRCVKQLTRNFRLACRAEVAGGLAGLVAVVVIRSGKKSLLFAKCFCCLCFKVHTTGTWSGHSGPF